MCFLRYSRCMIQHLSLLSWYEDLSTHFHFLFRSSLKIFLQDHSFYGTTFSLALPCQPFHEHIFIWDLWILDDPKISSPFRFVQVIRSYPYSFWDLNFWFPTYSRDISYNLIEAHGTLFELLVSYQALCLTHDSQSSYEFYCFIIWQGYYRQINL